MSDDMQGRAMCEDAGPMMMGSKLKQRPVIGLNRRLELQTVAADVAHKILAKVQPHEISLFYSMLNDLMPER